MRLTTIRLKDFFGIANVTTKTVSGISSQAKLIPEKVECKYGPLMVARNKLEKEEVLVQNNFGSIRFDCDNLVRRHGQFELSNDQKLYDTSMIKEKFVKSEVGLDPAEYEIHQDIQDDAGKPMDTSDKSLEEILQLFKKPKSKLTLKNVPPLTFDFDRDINQNLNHKNRIQDQDRDQDQTTGLIGDTKLSGKAEEIVVPCDDITVAEELVRSAKKDMLAYDAEMDEPEDWNQEYEMEPEIPVIEKRKKPVNAFDYVRENIVENDRFRSKVKLDSKGFHDYSEQVIDWYKIRRMDAINILKSSIIYDNYDVLAINKPYGLASHEENKKTEPYDINSLMQDIGKQTGSEKLYLAHRLDKSTTGVLVFARTQEKAKKLNKLFKADLIKKRYLCITVGVPRISDAIIDIPIGEFTVARKVRSCLVPEEWPADEQIAPKYKEARRAITEFHVLDDQKYWALVEVKPKSGVKHQIRCHMSFALRTPILGDHKYSHLTKIAPQELPAQMLKKLQLRKQKTRTLPIHLHASSIVLPDMKLDKSTLFITAPLPHHFKDNIKRLDLRYTE